ncbi:transporter substrate-binding domain-containing protein [Alcaligenaceae bacterium]|nr:transporter substrate-binding domain-containing protein [Alcaligenaceae bacterium]
MRRRLTGTDRKTARETPPARRVGMRGARAMAGVLLFTAGVGAQAVAAAQAVAPGNPASGSLSATSTAAYAAGPGAANGGGPLKLGMGYVVPPHVPGSKVRTPEGLAPVLAERLGRQLPLQPVAVPRTGAFSQAGPGLQDVDALLLPLDGDEAGLARATVIPSGYRAGIMAIMRTDTDIRRWEDLRGRTVCLAEGSGLAGQMQADYGAIEKVFRAPADALLDLRIGGCDAAVHDSVMLEALLEFPEWKKFSARLPVQREKDLAFVLPDGDAALARTLHAQVRQWRDADLLAKLTRQSARDIAFEVYMDQEVPDCH